MEVPDVADRNGHEPYKWQMYRHMDMINILMYKRKFPDMERAS